MLISSLLLNVIGLEKGFLEMPLYYNLLVKIPFDISDIAHDHKNKQTNKKIVIFSKDNTISNSSVCLLHWRK